MAHPLLVDLYELTMVAGYLRHGLHDRQAAFDLSFRQAPFGGGYAVFCGLEPALDHLEGMRFGREEIAYLRGLDLFEDGFLDWIASFRFSGTVTSVAEGEVVFGGEPILTVEGPLAACQIVETALLNLINFQTLVATKAARVVRESGEGGVVEFGARRAQGPDGALGASRAARVGGAASTSNLHAGSVHGIPVSGTQAHSWVMAFPSELEAFRAFAQAFPDGCVLLLDTYDTLRSGLPNAIAVARELQARGHRLRGVRLDSGDLAYLSKEVRSRLDAAGLGDVKVIASNEIDEHVIESIRKEGGRVDLYGVGTRLVTGAGAEGSAVGGVYKLVELGGEARIKVSSDRAKSSVPGRKRLWRAVRDGAFELDVVSGPDETPRPGDTVYDPTHPMRRARIPREARLESIRTAVMERGRRARPVPPLDAIADHARARLAMLPEGCRRLLNPHVYRVALTRGLHELRNRMIEQAASPAAPEEA